MRKLKASIDWQDVFEIISHWALAEGHQRIWIDPRTEYKDERWILRCLFNIKIQQP